MKSKGFTLIELLVVVAIISLLSSVVLTAVREARDKAKGRAYRQEMNELIKAIELYRADNPNTPILPLITSTYSKSSLGAITGEIAFETRLQPYLKKTPLPSFGNYYISRTGPWNCVGDNETSGSNYYYYILVYNSPDVNTYFSDWKLAKNGINAPAANHRCFSWY
jgi:prepilin-type N-terminal cleavage/methylation domain-containing protein